MQLTGICKGVLFSLFLVLPVTSQEQQWTTDMQRINYGEIGRAKLDLSSLNETMSSLKLPGFSSRPLTFEAGSHLLVQNLVLEGAIGTYLWGTRKRDNSQASLFGAYGNLVMGINFNMPGSSWKVYPFFNLGAALLRFSHHPGELDFTSNNAALTSDVYWLPTVVTGFVGAVMHVFHQKSGRGLFTVGLKGGFLVDPTTQSTWYRNGVSFKNGPSPLISGPFIKLVIGKGNYISG